MLKKGDKAPEFRLQDSNGTEIKLSDFLGNNVVLYFY
ncbi:MAG: redoxin domain-containing protein, partial [bacterium]|nr:redoxin domain-containing protein [bacterium]